MILKIIIIFLKFSKLFKALKGVVHPLNPSATNYIWILINHYTLIYTIFPLYFNKSYDFFKSLFSWFLLYERRKQKILGTPMLALSSIGLSRVAPRIFNKKSNLKMTTNINCYLY